MKRKIMLEAVFSMFTQMLLRQIINIYVTLCAIVINRRSIETWNKHAKIRIKLSYISLLLITMLLLPSDSHTHLLRVWLHDVVWKISNYSNHVFFFYFVTETIETFELQLERELNEFLMQLWCQMFVLIFISFGSWILIIQ
jgi:hypothetical protein